MHCIRRQPTGATTNSGVNNFRLETTTAVLELMDNTAICESSSSPNSNNMATPLNINDRSSLPEKRVQQLQLQSRQRDMSALQECIASERAVVEKMLKTKEHETEAAHQIIDQLSKDLAHSTAQNRVDRQRFDAFANQWSEERKNYIRQQEEFQKRMVEMQG